MLIHLLVIAAMNLTTIGSSEPQVHGSVVTFLSEEFSKIYQSVEQVECWMSLLLTKPSDMSFVDRKIKLN